MKHGLVAAQSPQGQIHTRRARTCSGSGLPWARRSGGSRVGAVVGDVALHQLDLLAHAAVTDVVVLSVVLEECRARSKASYDRLRALCQDPAKRFFVFANEHHRDTYVKTEAGESPNDRNDRAIRRAAPRTPRFSDRLARSPAARLPIESLFSLKIERAGALTAATRSRKQQFVVT